MLGDVNTAVRLRPLTDTDEEGVLALNETNVVNLAPLDAERLRLLRSWADRADAIEVGGEFAGFVITFRPGTAYDSENYRWFHDQYGGDFYYLDRIVVDKRLRRHGIGTAVYDALETLARPHRRMCLEVNLLPPNPASLSFHNGRGYVEVGTLGNSDHLVTLMAKELAEHQEA
jgi:predicted GNAT superfamily acetyltransferase